MATKSVTRTRSRKIERVASLEHDAVAPEGNWLQSILDAIKRGWMWTCDKVASVFQMIVEYFIKNPIELVHLVAKLARAAGKRWPKCEVPLNYVLKVLESPEAAKIALASV